MTRNFRQRIIAFILAAMTILTAVPFSLVAGESAANVKIMHEGKEVGSLLLAEDGEEILTAAVSGVNAVSYRWQICTDSFLDTWVTVNDRRAETCKVNYALVKSSIDASGKAYLRCVVNDGEKDYKSVPVEVTVSFKVPVNGSAASSLIVPQTNSTPVGAAATAAVPSNGIVANAGIALANAGIGLANSGTDVKHTIKILYLYPDEVTAATSPTVFSVSNGSSLNYSSLLPPVGGFQPTYTSAGETGGTLNKVNGTFDININSVTSDVTYTIIYEPQMMPYKVVHHLQNVDDEGYSASFEETKYAQTGSQVPDNLHKTAETDDRIKGFSYLEYARLEVAADGETTIDIYYNRQYYYVEYDLEEGVFGVESIAVRYGTTVVSKNPTRSGYDFEGWRLIGCGAEQDISTNPTYLPPTAQQTETFDLNKGSIVVPNHHIKYAPIWTQGDTSFTVVYWREAVSSDPNAEKTYEYWGSKIYGVDDTIDGNIYYTGDVKTGDIITPNSSPKNDSSVIFKNVPADISTIDTVDGRINEIDYFIYNQQKSEKVPSLDSNGNQIYANGEPVYTAEDVQVVIEGDRSSVLNIYYDRKEYTFKFYYAAEDTQTNRYYLTGRTNHFGDTNNDDEIELFDQFISGSGWGSASTYFNEVVSLPTIPQSVKDLYGEENFKTDTSKRNANYKYYYFTFNAKYGQDISKLWPTTDFLGTTNRANTQNNGTWNKTTVVFSGWNGEYNVYNSRHYKGDSPTIKGQYRKVDHRILWEPSRVDENFDGTVTYLAYWSNAYRGGAWSTPALYRYNIYLECLDQTKHEEAGAIQFAPTGGTQKWYYPVEKFAVADNAEIKNLQVQSPPSIQGFINVNNNTFLQGSEYVELEPLSATNPNGYDPESYVFGYDLFFFYDRERYALKFNNMGEYLKNMDANGNYVEELPIRYQVSLYNPQGYDLSMLERPGGGSYYPEGLDPEGYEFGGWYLSPNFAAGTEFTFDESSEMPAHDMELYAKWQKKIHKVWIYDKEEHADAQDSEGLLYSQPAQIEHGSLAPTPNDPADVEGMTFAGWYYKHNDENGDLVESRFIFTTMPINREMHVYAKYESRDVVEYKIHYVALKEYKIENGIRVPVYQTQEDGKTPLYIAESKSGHAVIGTHITVEAKVENDLYENYREHWYPEPITQDLKLVKPTEDSTVEENVKYIYYVEKTVVPYKVVYVDAETDQVLDSQEHRENRNTIVTEDFKTFAGYIPDELQKRLILSASTVDEDNDGIADDNVLYFYYTKSDTEAVVQVIEYIQGLSGNNEYVEYTNTSATLTVSDNVNEYDVVIKSILGFKFNNATINGQHISDPHKFTESEIKVSLTASNTYLVELYYNRFEVEYEVHYLRSGTNEELAPNDTGMGLHGQSVAVNAKSIQGYRLVSGSHENRVINLTYNNGEKNIVQFFYEPVIVTVHYQVVCPDLTSDQTTTWLSASTLEFNAIDQTAPSSTPMLNPTHDSTMYRFVGWYYDEACTIKVVDPAWINSEDQTITPQRTGSIFTDVTYYAKFEPATTTLTIKTDFLVSQGVYSSLEPNKTWIFHIKGNDANNEHIDLHVTVHGKGSVTIVDIPVGNYTINERSDWSWRYDMREGIRTLDVTSAGATVTFVPVRNRVQWLDGDTYDVNIFNGVGHGDQTPDSQNN